MEQTIKVIYASSKVTWISKLALRALSALLTIIVVGIAGWLASREASSYSYSGSYLPILVVGTQIVIAFIWDVAEIISLLVRKGHRGIHPGACVTLDLLLWLGLVIGAVFIGFFCDGRSCYYDYDDYDLSSGPDYRSALIALCSLLIIVHFSLFVIACWETSIRNRAVRIIIDRNAAGAQMTHDAQQLYYNYKAQHLPQPQPQFQPQFQPPPGGLVASPHELGGAGGGQAPRIPSAVFTQPFQFQNQGFPPQGMATAPPAHQQDQQAPRAPSTMTSPSELEHAQLAPGTANTPPSQIYDQAQSPATGPAGTSHPQA